MRQAWRHPLLTALNVLGIALGISVFLAIQIANRGALASFEAAAELTTGRADIEIRGDLPDDLFPAATAVEGVKAATPLVEGIVTRPDAPGEYLRILGVDPFTGSDIFSFSLGGAEDFDIEAWLSNPAAIAIQPGAPVRGRIEVLAGSTRRTLEPVSVFQAKDAVARGDLRTVAMDIGWAQELFGMVGRLSSIQILLDDPGSSEAVAEKLRQIAPAGATVAPPAARHREMQTMLSAFQLNLTAMSLVSVIVGMFLISNSVAAAVVRRRVDIAILRACGAARWKIRGLFLGEAAIEAALGVAAALFLAPALAEWMAQPFSRSLSSIYELVRLGPARLEPWQIAQAFGVGLFAALCAAWMPASEAARCEPARILHPGAGLEIFHRLRRRDLLWAGLLLAGAAGLCVRSLNGGSKHLGFAAAAAVLAGFSLLVPWLSAGLAVLLRHERILVRLAAGQFTRASRRNSVTIAALAAAAAMAVSVTVMIHSFRSSVQRWVEQTLTADLFIAPAVNEIAGPTAFLPAGSLAWAEEQPDVLEAGTFREMTVQFRGEGTAISVINGRARGPVDFLSPNPARAAGELEEGAAVAVSESFARRFGVTPGQSILLPTAGGDRTFPVCGIFRDYSRDRGTILMLRPLFEKHWPDPRIHSLALRLREPGHSAAVADKFRAQFGGEFVIYDNASLRARVFEIFDQTFAVTAVLRSIAVLVAVAGVLFSLSTLVIEREREIGVLRAVGASRSQVLGMFLVEAFLIGLAASVSGLASGAVLAVVLTWVINKAYFGWTIELSFPPEALAMTPAWILGAALLAALLPAWKAACVAPARAVRFE